MNAQLPHRSRHTKALLAFAIVRGQLMEPVAIYQSAIIGPVVKGTRKARTKFDGVR